MEESIEDLEARLYAQVYHDPNLEVSSETLDKLPPNLNKQSNQRYWQRSKNISSLNSDTPKVTQVKEQKQFTKTSPISSKIVSESKNEETSTASVKSPAIKTFVPYTSVLSFMEPPVEVSKTFVPYTSVLSFMNPPMEVSKTSQNSSKKSPKTPNYEKRDHKSINKFPKAGKLLNPLNQQGIVKKKLSTRLQVQAKKQKAIQTRKKSQSKVVTTIELEDSDESDCVPIELPPPPLISLDSSDDEMNKSKRALSPSTCSMISDDFIVAGDKVRLADPFMSIGSEKPTTKILPDTLEKVKALTKIASSTSSSDSARSSIERSNKPNTSQGSLSGNVEDSIYGAKGKAKKLKSNDNNDNEIPCVNAINDKNRRRKNDTNQDKSDSEPDEDPKLKLIANVQVAQVRKRSRFITPNYNEDEFATMISTILRSGDLDDDEVDKTNEVSKASEEQEDCRIVEKPIDVVEVPDDDDNHGSDSNDSMRGFKTPIACDLTLNVTHVPYEPHEFIRNNDNQSQMIPSTNDRNDQTDPEFGWNDEMKFFYHGSWGGESFCLSQVLSEMPRDPKLWKIDNSDRSRVQESGIRVRCKRCNEIGHYAVKCNRPRRRVVCFMCGEEGHRETRCPNSICLRCGKPNKMFATTCTACNRLSKKYCPLCNFQGHDMEQCPDKWRRYHSTTSETTQLNSEYQINPRVYCSICARRGHFAEYCNQFFKTISGLITSSSINITSHKPSYTRNYLDRFDMDMNTIGNEQRQTFSLISYFPYFRFNFQFPRNVRIYPKFLEYFESYKKQMMESKQITMTQEKKSKNKKRKKKLNETDSNEIVASTAKENEDSNSNYSFSDFYSSSTTQQKNATSSDENVFKSPSDIPECPQKSSLVKNPFASSSTQLADYIPLGSDENITQSVEAVNKPPIEIQREPEVSSVARVLLTKEHFTLLSTKEGQNFLTNLQDRHIITSEFKWDNSGNSLLITGFPSNQSMFHLEVREYLYRVEMEKHQKTVEASTQLPKTKVRIVSFLKNQFKLIAKSHINAVRSKLQLLMNAERSLDHKKTINCRRVLNIAFIGDGELSGGREHVGALRKILYKLENELNQDKHDLSFELREEIIMHMKPIFSPMNHGDYRQLFNEYSKVMRQRKNRKLLRNPIILND